VKWLVILLLASADSAHDSLTAPANCEMPCVPAESHPRVYTSRQGGNIRDSSRDTTSPSQYMFVECESDGIVHSTRGHDHHQHDSSHLFHCLPTRSSHPSTNSKHSITLNTHYRNSLKQQHSQQELTQPPPNLLLQPLRCTSEEYR
jgi:hypothetical protein